MIRINNYSLLYIYIELSIGSVLVWWVPFRFLTHSIVVRSNNDFMPKNNFTQSHSNVIHYCTFQNYAYEWYSFWLYSVIIFFFLSYSGNYEIKWFFFCHFNLQLLFKKLVAAKLLMHIYDL